jgi:glucose/arabinose dehydrogenase
MRSIRRLAAAALLAAAIGLPTTATAAAFDPEAVDIELTPIVSGLVDPVFVTHAGDGSGRLFIVEQRGIVRVRTSGGTVLPAPFLDLRASVLTGGEQGLLGLAFHPNHETNRLFYVAFTDRNGNFAVSELRVSPTNPNAREAHWGRRLLTIAHPYTNHNGGMIAFGPYGYLFIGTGDGGSSNDPGNRAQSLNSLLGKLLRIDVNRRTGSLAYGIPSGNPYRGKPGRDEIYSYGLRNPWRFSFDRATNMLFIGDVGQNRYEEIDRPTYKHWWGKRVNYGWRVMEGNACNIPPTGCSTTFKTRPIAAYDHSVGCSVTGGYVYRGSQWPALQGGYFFADYCSGRIWAFEAPPPTSSPQGINETLMLDTSLNISSFGEDQAGEVYVVDREGGVVYQIDQVP